MVVMVCIFGISGGSDSGEVCGGVYVVEDVNDWVVMRGLVWFVFSVKLGMVICF